jgi:hypothetical protein
MEPDKLKISPTLGDVDRGLKSGTPKRVLYKELGKIADLSRGKDDEASKTVFEKLKEKAEEIHGTVTEKKRG